MGGRFNTRTEDQPDQVNRFPVRSSVFIVSNPARSDSIAVKTEIGSIPEPGRGSWRGSVHCVESGQRTLFPNREQQLLWNRHHRVELEFIVTRYGSRSVW